jgi:uncharacterized protein YmfQ (DUF2313 family)
MSRDTALAMYRMLPTGDAWPDYQEDTEIKNLITGLSKSVDDYITTVKNTMAQYYPGQPEIFMTDWEEVLALPKCGQVGQSIQTRLSQILAMFRISPYSNAQFFIDIAEVFGYDIDVLKYHPATIEVSGADDAGTNGTYTYDSIFNTRPKYIKPPYDLEWDGNWVINNTGANFYLWNPGFISYNYLPNKDEWGNNPFNADLPAPTLAYDNNQFEIIIEVQSIESILFRAGVSSVGDPLEEIQAGTLECILNFFKQSHTNLVFTVAP